MYAPRLLWMPQTFAAVVTSSAAAFMTTHAAPTTGRYLLHKKSTSARRPRQKHALEARACASTQTGVR